MRSIGPDLNRAGNNFDLLRLLAASLVVVAHASVVLYNQLLVFDPVRMLTGIEMGKMGVLIFFVISGYLVSASWNSRNNTFLFIKARILRIFPAVIIVVLLSVFVLGWAITTAETSNYFRSDLTWKYLQNMTLYRMYYYLPGVFEHNPTGASVNASLWTLPYEFTCYLFVLLTGIAGLFYNRYIFPILLVSCIVSYSLFQPIIDTWVIPILGIDFKTFGILFLYFLAGMTFYTCRNLVPFNVPVLILCIVIASLMKMEFLPQILGVVVWPYCILYMASIPLLRKLRPARYGDFSYGLYLYAFPVQQLIVLLIPEPGPYWKFVLLSFLCTLPFAILSWHLVEKPALSLKGK